MKRIKDLPLRDKLMLSYLVIIVLALSIFGSFALHRSSLVIKQQVEASSKQTVNQAKTNLESYMLDVENILMKIHVDKTVQDILTSPEPESVFQVSRDVKSLENVILGADIFRKKTSFIRLFALDKNNYPVIDSGNYVFSSKYAENQDWFVKTMKNKGKPYWHLDNNYICVARLILDVSDSRRSVGVVEAGIDANKFLEEINKIRLGKTGRVFLIANAMPVAKLSGTYNSLVSSPTFFSTIYRDSAGSSFETFDDIEYMIIYNEVSNVGWKLVGVVPTLELIENMNLIRSAIIIIAIISLMVAFGFSMFISYRISQPIHALANRMRNFNSEQYAKVSISSHDEIGEIYSSFNNMLERIEQLIEEVNERSRKEKEAEFRALQAQINPHFLYNTLDSINWLAIKSGADDISLMVNSLANFLRHSLNKGKEFISIANELEHVKSYVTIQKFRFKNKFDIEFDVNEEVLKYLIIKLTLQPLVENAINHGFDAIDYKGFIRIEACKDDDYIYLKVIDNGKGADIDSLNQSLLERDQSLVDDRGYGIRNVNERLKLYFGEDCGIKFEDNQYGGVTVNVRVRALMLEDAKEI